MADDFDDSDDDDFLSQLNTQNNAIRQTQVSLIQSHLQRHWSPCDSLAVS